MKVSRLFVDFLKSEKTGGIVLIVCTALSLILANSAISEDYIHFWHMDLAGKAVEFWVNDGLMTVFFLLVGLEIEREVYIGELSNFRKALLPIMAALGGMIVPALIHYSFNSGTNTEEGFGIPMATDIAFSLAILSLLGSRVPSSLKVFLTALAIIDDLGAIIVIAIFYSTDFSVFFLSMAFIPFAIMLALNRFKVYILWIYLLLGMVMWYFMYQSGIHATITGVLLAFAIPFGKGDAESISWKLQHKLHRIVAFFILPVFALANTAIIIPPGIFESLFTPNSKGIILGLVAGKPIGVFLFSTLAIMFGWAILPGDLKKRDLLCVGFLAGIGFTMSIFITLLAFEDPQVVSYSKISIILSSIVAAVLGFVGLKVTLRKP